MLRFGETGGGIPADGAGQPLAFCKPRYPGPLYVRAQEPFFCRGGQVCAAGVIQKGPGRALFRLSSRAFNQLAHAGSLLPVADAVGIGPFLGSAPWTTAISEPLGWGDELGLTAWYRCIL